MFGINTGAARKKQFFDFILIGGVNDVGLNGKIFVNKLGRIDIVTPDTAHFCCRQENIIRFFFFKKGLHPVLPQQVQLGMGSGNNIFVAFGLKLAYKSRSDKPPVLVKK